MNNITNITNNILLAASLSFIVPSAHSQVYTDQEPMIGAPEFDNPAWSTERTDDFSHTYSWHFDTNFKSTLNSGKSITTDPMFAFKYRPSKAIAYLTLNNLTPGDYYIQFDHAVDDAIGDKLQFSINGLPQWETDGVKTWRTSGVYAYGLGSSAVFSWTFYRNVGVPGFSLCEAWVDGVKIIPAPIWGLTEPQMKVNYVSDGTVVMSWPYPSIGYDVIQSKDLVNWTLVNDKKAYIAGIWVIKSRPAANSHVFYTLRKNTR